MISNDNTFAYMDGHFVRVLSRGKSRWFRLWYQTKNLQNTIFCSRFDIPKQKELFYNNSERSRIVDFILRRKAFGEDKSEAYTFGKS